jgi:hypothetical protein
MIYIIKGWNVRETLAVVKWNGVKLTLTILVTDNDCSIEYVIE